MPYPAVTRLAAPIAAVSVLLLVLSVIAAWYVWDMEERARGPIALSVASVTAAQELEISIRELLLHFNRYLITLDRKHLLRVPELKARTAKALDIAERSATTPLEEALMQRTRRGYDHLFSVYDGLIKNPPKEGMYIVIMKLMDEVMNPEILEPAHEYLQMNEVVLTQATQTNQQVAQRLVVGLVAMGLFGSLGGLLAGGVIVATIRRNIARTEERLRTTAETLDRAAHRGGKSSHTTTVADPLEQVRMSATAVVKRLRETERDALRAEQLAWVGQMAAGIAHEIRNPLMAIKLIVQAGAERAGGPSLRSRDFEVLDEEITRLEHIVSGFLDFARPPRPNPRQMDLADAVAQAMSGAQQRAELQGVSLSLEHPKQPIVVSADPNQLRQVFLNLLINALDAQPLGGEIRVKLGIEQAPEPSVVMTVADAGPGIAAGVAERIFEPFVSTKESGLGLGLSICRRIADAHGGTLSAGNGPGQGAVFTLKLPAGTNHV